jgi:cysteinyl-tRNA synthetase
MMIRSISLFNTLTRSLEPLTPLTPGEVSLYCCGPTVYNFQHIGNFKTFLFEDVLVRTLRFIGYKVHHVMNITDVGHQVGDGDDGEDKMSVAKKREKKSSKELADFYTDHFFQDWDALGMVRPSRVCKATDHIQEMINLIERIIENGYGYESNGNIYFDVLQFKQYGQLAKLDLEALQAGARIEIDSSKRSPFDFALWFTNSKFSDQELQWDSPWGRGYPGWHIECSAMAMKHLGEHIDIHCGGIDHIPVHHTNEIAQSEAATGKQWVNVWMHSEFILINNEKMSKSTGGFLVLKDLVNEGFEPAVYRLLVLSANYRQQLNFSWDALANAKRSLEKLKQGVLRLKSQVASVWSGSYSSEGNEILEDFTEALCSDLNTAKALAACWRALQSQEMNPEEKLAVLERMDLVLGLGVASFVETIVEAPADALALLDARNAARASKDWAQADALRDQLKEMGWQIEDGGGGSSLKPV